MPTERYMPEDQVETWRLAAKEASEASSAVSRAVFALLLLAEPGSKAEEALKLLLPIEDSLRGMAYRLTPQPEWLGGPIETAITKHCWPHL